jgi:hypothetical protein
MMEHVLFNYVVGGVVVEGPMSYATVLERTGLKDTVGLTELGYIEHMPVSAPVPLTNEQIVTAVRNGRNYLLQQSDWTQIADSPITAEEKSLWTTYRQQLRDMPATCSQVTSFEEVIWPLRPGETATVAP